MNETMQTILARRAIRGYTTQQISDADRDIILKAAIYAPSAMGLQQRHFAVIQRKELIDEMAKGVREEMLKRELPPVLRERLEAPGYHSLYNAPTIIVISGSADARFAMADCAAAAQNILLAAESLGLGSCFTAMNAEYFTIPAGHAFAERVGIPEGYTPLYVITLGYKASPAPEAAPRRENSITIVN